MDPACLQHTLTAAELEQFERDGYSVIPEAIPRDLVETLIPISDEIDRSERARQQMASDARVNHYDFIGRDSAYLPLLDWLCRYRNHLLQSSMFHKCLLPLCPHY